MITTCRSCGCKLLVQHTEYERNNGTLKYISIKHEPDEEHTERIILWCDFNHHQWYYVKTELIPKKKKRGFFSSWFNN